MKPTLILPVREFYLALKTNALFSQLEQAFSAQLGRAVGPSERSSWHASLPRLAGAMELADLPPSTLIGLEVQVPYYSERIDATLYGFSEKDRPQVVLVELKQWSDVVKGDDGNLSVRMRTGAVSVLHPSIQALGYKRHLADFVRAFHNEPAVGIACCAYAHNYPQRGGSLFAAEFASDAEVAPIFCATDAEEFARFMRDSVGGGRGVEVAERVRLEGIGPSKSLIGLANETIRKQDVFTMLDEQIPAQRAIRTAVNEAIKHKRKSVVLVDGGPGTGKSVIALDAFGNALRKDLGAFLVSGSAAFTHGIRRLLGPRLDGMIKFTDYFWSHLENSVDVLIIDEAHRIRAKSVPRVKAHLRPKISQLEELIRAARVTVLFMDTNQIIDPDECGSPEELAALCERLGIRLSCHSLRAQFRCDGSDRYLNWVDTLFALSSSASEATDLLTPQSFDFGVLDSPSELLEWVRAMNEKESGSARLAAGWCWPWSDPLPDGSLVNDIVIGDFEFPWELKNGKKGRLGIPQAKHWAIDPAGVDQAGTVYSVQGFEFRHVGVLMGNDLVIRNGQWLAQPKANVRNGIRSKPPEMASIYIRRIYRALFTRPLRSLRVYSVDAETREFLRSRLAVGATDEANFASAF